MSDTWTITHISTPWLAWGSSSNNHAADRRCKTCGVVFLTGEKAGFCCGPGGNRFSAVQPLPPLPNKFNTFLDSPDIFEIISKVESDFFVCRDGIYTRVSNSRKSQLCRCRWTSVPPRPSATTRQYSDPVDALRWDSRTHLFLILHKPEISHYRGFTLFRCHYHSTTPSHRRLSLRTLRLQQPAQFGSASIIVQDSGCAEIAAVMCYENTLRSQISPRSLLISTNNNGAQSIQTVSRLWEPMATLFSFLMGLSDGV